MKGRAGSPSAAPHASARRLSLTLSLCVRRLLVPFYSVKHKTFEFLLCFRAWGRIETQHSQKSPLNFPFFFFFFLRVSKKQQKPNDTHKHCPAEPDKQAQQLKGSQADPVLTPSGRPSLWHSTELSATSGFPAAKQPLQHLAKFLRTVQILRNRTRPRAEALLALSISLREHQRFTSSAFPFNTECTGFPNWMMVHSAANADPIRAVIKGVSTF